MGLFFEHSNYAFVENEEEEEEKEDFALTLSSTLVSLITLLLHTTTVLPTNLWLSTFLVSIGEGLTDKVSFYADECLLQKEKQILVRVLLRTINLPDRCNLVCLNSRGNIWDN